MSYDLGSRYCIVWCLQTLLSIYSIYFIHGQSNRKTVNIVYWNEKKKSNHKIKL